MNRKLTIIADDFTGGNDVGIQLKKYGLDIITTSKYINSKDTVNIMSTETRNCTEDDSREIIREFFERILKTEFTNLYKKIDSTLRGNIRVEIEEILKKTEDKIIFVSGFPSAGRTVIDGYHYVNGIPLNQTEFARDPIKPIKENNLRKILNQGEIINLEQIRGDLTERIKSIKERLIIFDSEQESDLDIIAKTIVEQKMDRFIVGSAGIMNYLPKYWGYKENRVIIVSGSCSEINSKQLKKFLNKNIMNIRSIEIEDININYSKYENYDIVIDTSKSQAAPKTIAEQCGKLVKNFTHRFRIKRIFSTGGEISISILNELGIEGIQLINRIETGIALGRASNSDFLIVTKPGAFGSENIYKKCYDILKTTS